MTVIVKAVLVRCLAISVQSLFVLTATSTRIIGQMCIGQSQKPFNRIIIDGREIIESIVVFFRK